MVSIIIVTFNSSKYIRACIDSIYEKTSDCDYEIIVVDNNSSDDTVDILYHEYKKVRLIRNTHNTGFAKANNKGIRRAKGDYIMLLNPDTVLKNNAITLLRDFLDSRPDAGCVGSKLTYFDGKHQLSCRKFPNFYNVFFGRKSVLRFAFPNNPISKQYMQEHLDYSAVQTVDWVMGAAMMIKKEVLDHVGLFDEDFFLFVEDTDLCYRFMQNEYKVYYYPEAQISHFHGASVRTRFNIAQLQHNISMYKFFRKYMSNKGGFNFILYIAILIRLIFIFIAGEITKILRELLPHSEH